MPPLDWVEWAQINSCHHPAGGMVALRAKSMCPMRGGWEKINRAIRAALEDVSLAELSQPPDFLMAPVSVDAEIGVERD